MATLRASCDGLQKGTVIMPFQPEVLDDLLKDCKTPEQMFGSDGLLQQLTKALIERSLQAELTHHLGLDHARFRRGQLWQLQKRHVAQNHQGQARASTD